MIISTILGLVLLLCEICGVMAASPRRELGFYTLPATGGGALKSNKINALDKLNMNAHDGHDLSRYIDTGFHLETYRLDKFPENKVSMHMSCSESEQFATNCACHIKCLDRDCNNARDLCHKYKDKGCKYMLLRGPPDKQLATLKRVPTIQELASFDISSYPDSQRSLHSSDIWKQYKARQSKNEAAMQRNRSKTIGLTIGDLVHGQDTVNALMREVPTNSFCPNTKAKNETWRQRFINRGISIVALSYRTPKSLLNSMRSWKTSHLLDFVQEKHIILNDPMPQDMAIAAEHEFQIHQPQDFTAGDPSLPLSSVRMSKPNVITIGSAFYAAMHLSSSEYVLFLENDFKMDVDMTAAEIQAQLVGAAGMLDRGAEIVRLLSRKAKGCGTQKDCGHAFRPSPNNHGGDRKRNWFSFYCAGYPGTEPYVADCLNGEGKLMSAVSGNEGGASSPTSLASKSRYVPRFRCFTSWDSNWSVNAVLVNRKSMLSRQYRGKDGSTVGPIADLGRSFWAANDGFERAMAFDLQWMNWQPRVPICISYDGMFRHEEIETGA